MDKNEAIKKSIARNALREKTGLNSTASLSNQGNFEIFVRLMNGEFLAKIALTVCIVFCVSAFTVFRQTYELTALETLPYLVLALVVVVLLYFAYFYVFYISYQNFLKNELIRSSAWQAFISSRSEDFLKGKRFVRVTINIQPTATANALHHQAVSDFLFDWTKRSSHLYDGTKWTKRRPDSFSVSGYTLNGHIGVGNGMTFVIRSLSSNLISLFKTVGEQNLSFSIRYDNEVTFSEDTSLDSIDAAKDREYERNLRD